MGPFTEPTSRILSRQKRTVSTVTYNLKAVCKGVVTATRHAVNPSFKRIDIEPDIQKVYRANQINQELSLRNAVTLMREDNPQYEEEYRLWKDRRWRESALRKREPLERFEDPNAFTRGVVPFLNPLIRQAT